MVFALVYGFFEAQFQTNDDAHMMLTASGISKVSEPSRMLLFSHVFIGDALVRLYAGWPTVPWYGIYLVLALFAGHTAILGTALHRRPAWTTLGIYFLHYVFLGSMLLLELQFTIVSSVLATGAFCLLILLPLPERSGSLRAGIRAWLPFLIGILLSLISGMIRWKSELMMAALLTPMLLVICIGLSKRAVAIRLALFAGALVLGLGVQQIHRQVYDNDPGWADHLRFNALRAEFTDYGAFVGMGSKERAAILDTVGWTLNDATLLSKFFFIDKKVFSIEKLREIVERTPRLYDSRVPRVAEFLGNIVTTPLAIGACLLWLFCFSLAQWRWRSVLICLSGPIGAVTLLAAITLLLRTPVARIVWPLLFFMVVPPLMFLAGREGWRHRRALRLSLLLVVAAIMIVRLPAIVSKMTAQSQTLQEDRLTLRRELQQMGPKPDQLFVVFPAVFPWGLISPFKTPDYLQNFKVFSLGSGQRTPDAAKILSEFKIRNLPLSLGRRDDLFLIDFRGTNRRFTKFYAVFMKEHHGLQVNLQTQRIFSSFIIQRVKFTRISTPRAE